MAVTPDKGPIRFPNKYLKILDLINNLDLITNGLLNIEKWPNNAQIDNKLSTNYWKNPKITDPQKTCLIKFHTG